MPRLPPLIWLIISLLVIGFLWHNPFGAGADIHQAFVKLGDFFQGVMS